MHWMQRWYRNPDSQFPNPEILRPSTFIPHLVLRSCQFAFCIPHFAHHWLLLSNILVPTFHVSRSHVPRGNPLWTLCVPLGHNFLVPTFHVGILSYRFASVSAIIAAELMGFVPEWRGCSV